MGSFGVGDLHSGHPPQSTSQIGAIPVRGMPIGGTGGTDGKLRIKSRLGRFGPGGLPGSEGNGGSPGVDVGVCARAWRVTNGPHNETSSDKLTTNEAEANFTLV